MSTDSQQVKTVPTAEETARQRSIKDRLFVGRWLACGFRLLFALTVALPVFFAVVIYKSLPSDNPTAVMAFALLIQVAIGMVTGYICIFMGLLMTWYGISAAYSLDVSASSGDTKGGAVIRSASPGLVFAIGGMILVAVSLYKDVSYQETGGQPRFFGPNIGQQQGIILDHLPPIQDDK